MIKITNIFKDGTVKATVEFDGEFDIASARSFLESAIGSEQAKQNMQNASTVAAMTQMERAICAQVGVSPRLFAKYNPR